MGLPLKLLPLKRYHFLAPNESQVDDRTQIANPKIRQVILPQTIGKLRVSLLVLLESLNIKPYVTASNLHDTNDQRDH